MSNEHLTEVGESLTDRAEPGRADDLDDGPLDPSVFFGLFDDLGDDDPGDDDLVDADPGDEDPWDDDPGDDDLVDDDPGDDHEQVETAGADLDDINLIDNTIHHTDPTVTAVDETKTDRVPTEPASTPDEAEPPLTPDVAEPAHNGTAPDAPAINWASTLPESESTVNGREPSIASPPPIPPQYDQLRQDLNSNGLRADNLISKSPPNVTFTPAETAEREPTPVKPPTRPPSRRSTQRGDRGGTLAKAALATIAVGLLGGLVVAFVLSLDQPDTAATEVADGQTSTADPAGSSVAAASPTNLPEAIEAGRRPTSEFLVDHVGTVLPTAVNGRLDASSLRFEPGTTELDGSSATLVDELASVLIDQPSMPVTLSVRTYSELTPADNLELSIAQAEALTAVFVAAGADPDQIRAVGLGATPLSPAQPVPNFVLLTPDFGDLRLAELLAEQSPFSLGMPAITSDDVWPLRPDGLFSIGAMADALIALPDTTIGAAGYSFFPPSEADAKREAEAAADGLVRFLDAAYGLDPNRITVITPGSAVFVPTPDQGNHIWVQIGPATQGAFDVAAIDPADITFQPGSAELDTTGSAAVSALAEILTTGGATIVVDVRAYEAADEAANLTLSQQRRDSLAEALVTAGVAPEQLRIYASGASSHFADDRGPTITLTVAP